MFRGFFNKPEVGGRLIRLGCLFCDANRSGPLGDRYEGNGVPAGDVRSAAEANADRGAYEAIVNIANFCSAFRFDKACTRLVVMQALHVAERGAHHLLKTVHSAITSDYQKHTVSATHGGAKTTMRTYAGYIERFGAWGAANLTTALLPLSRHVVVSYLEVEATRRIAHSVRSAQRRRRATTTSLASAKNESNGGDLCSSSDDAVKQGVEDAEVPVAKRLRRGGGWLPPGAGSPGERGWRAPSESGWELASGTAAVAARGRLTQFGRNEAGVWGLRSAPLPVNPPPHNGRNNLGGPSLGVYYSLSFSFW